MLAGQFLAVILILNGYRAENDGCKFPSEFLFGVASSAHQIEGAWNEGGKSPSIWDHYAHKNPKVIRDLSTADVSSDGYHHLEKDVPNLRHLGVDFYRFSISWPRILPDTNQVNQEGIQYYNRLIDSLLENGITPFVTLFHWDLPQQIQDIGGFANPEIVKMFENYSRVAFRYFGDRVKLWTTFNEPKMFCTFGYGNVYFAPGLNQSGIADYLCGYNILKAHAKVYHLYHNVFKPIQKGRISINLDSPWAEPLTDSDEDKSAAERYLQFELGWFSHPIFSKEGDYPKVMKDRIARHSKEEGFPRSRLPELTKSEVDYIRGTYDFFCLNFYMVKLVTDLTDSSSSLPSYVKDVGVNAFDDESWEHTDSSFFKAVPWSITKLLVWLKENYNDPEIYITENGCPDNAEAEDTKRIAYLKGYLNAILEAICKHQVNVKSYTHWSFIDSFEWFSGYTIKFGLFHVNFTDPSRPRTPKQSAEYYRKTIITRIPA